MADTKKSAPPSERPLPNVAIQHRLNHIGHGNLGRLAYSPVSTDHEVVGRLQTSMSVDSDQHFRVLSHFTELLPPARSALRDGLASQKPSDAARSQKNWLLEHHPEVVAGGDIDVRNLATELKEAKLTANEDAAATTSSLLAVGEITDRTNVHSGTVGQPAIAMAAGEGGHVLCIMRLEEENGTWPERALSVPLVKLSTSARGDWAEDGVPISLIRFAIDTRRYDPIRWLLVQRPSGTTLLEPEIRVLATQSSLSEYEQSHLHSQMPRYITANPLFTIGAKRTGGVAHVDVCFNPVVDGRFPQLAIIDETGHWSIWDITGSRSVVPKTFQPIVTARGSIDIGPLPSLETKLGKTSAAHKILYVLPKGDRRIKREEEFEHAQDQHWGLYSRLPVRCYHLLVCSDTDVRLYDASQGTQLAGIRVVNVNRAERIVDMQPCPSATSQAIVLTTSSIYWIEAKLARDGQARIGVICSFPHHGSQGKGDLILSLSSLPNSGRSQACVALVVYSQDKAANLFYFQNWTSDEVAHSVHTVLRADLPSTMRSVFMAAHQVGHGGVKSEIGSSVSSASRSEDGHVLQLFGLKSDLSLGSALFAVSDRPLAATDAPRSSHAHGQPDKLRKKLLRLLGNAFVVPESYEDQPEAPGVDAENDNHGPDLDEKPVAKRNIINLQAACERLHELAMAESNPAKVSRQLLAGIIHRRGMEELGDSEYMPVRTLSELVGDKLNSCNLDTLEEEWTEFRDQIHSAYEGRVQVMDVAGLDLPRDLQSLTWQLSSLSFVNEDTPDSYKERQRHLLRHLSGKQYLSLFGISVPPPSAVPSIEKETASQRATQPDDESVLPSSPIPSGSQTRPSQDRMDIDSDHPSQSEQGPLSRLRKYIDIPNNPSTIPLSNPSSTRLLSRWPAVHTDPSSFVWEEDEGPLTAEDEEAMQKRKRRDEARRRRSVKARLSMGLPVEDDGAVGAGAGPSTQPAFMGTPRGVMSSQPRGLMESQMQSQSQSQGTPLRPRISMSQVMPGAYGGRPGTAKKKARKSIFR